MFMSLRVILEPFRTFPPFIFKFTYITPSSLKIGWIFGMNISPFDKTVSFDFSHLINNKCFNQCRTVVLCDHAYLFLAISLLRQVLAFSAKVADMCPTNNSRRAIVNFFLANLDLLAIKF